MIEGKEIIKDEVANAASRNDELESREKKYEVDFISAYLGNTENKEESLLKRMFR